MKYNIGLEWEFYIINDQSININPESINIFLEDLKNNLNIIDNIDIEEEKGEYQFEVKIKPYQNINLLCKNFTKIKKITSNIIEKHNFKSNFESQPFKNDCGSSLQINLNIFDKNNNNKFIQNSSKESLILLYSIGGILKYCNDYLQFYIDKKEDLLRFDININSKLHKNGKYTSPVNISWGYDNRTTAIRIIGKENNRRIEFRVPSSNANLKKILKYLFKSIEYGINNKTLPENSIYGNAIDYDLIKLSTK